MMRSCIVSHQFAQRRSPYRKKLLPIATGYRTNHERRTSSQLCRFQIALAKESRLFLKNVQVDCRPFTCRCKYKVLPVRSPVTTALSGRVTPSRNEGSLVCAVRGCFPKRLGPCFQIVQGEP